MTCEDSDNRPLVVFGLSALAGLVVEQIQAEGRRTVAALTVDRAYAEVASIDGIPVCPVEDLPERFPPDSHDAIVALRYADLCGLRAEKFRLLKDLGYRLPGWVHPTVRVDPGARVGENVILFAHTYVAPDACLDDNIFIWGRAVVARGARIGAHCFIASNTTFLEDVEVGARCFIGPNVTVGQGVSVGPLSVIGGGCLVAAKVADAAVLGAVTKPPRAAAPLS